VFINYGGSNQYQRRAALEEIKMQPQEQSLFDGHIHSPASYDQQLAAAFIDVYLPPSCDHWLHGVAGVLHSSETLRISMRALGLSRLGFSVNDQAMLRSGLEAYGKALGHVRDELQKPTSQIGDGTIAAIRVLALFQVA
jgi:hypothetical protein